MIADLTELYSERLESIDPGPVEAIRATGANDLQAANELYFIPFARPIELAASGE